METKRSARKHRTDDTGLDQLDPATHPAREATHFRNIVAARKRADEAQAELRAAVQAAREAGDSWFVIGSALGVTKQAAYQRFDKTKQVSVSVPREITVLSTEAAAPA